MTTTNHHTPISAGEMQRAPVNTAYGSLDSVLTNVIGTDGTLLNYNFGAVANVDIVSGSATFTKSNMTIDTAGDIASDDLDTIVVTTSEAFGILRALNDAQTVVVKHQTGNIRTYTGEDISLDSINKVLFWYYDGTDVFVTGAAGSGSIDVNGLTEKVSPVSADVLLIEDSADSFNQKKVQAGNLPTAGGAPLSAEYVVMTLNGTLTGERALVAGNGLTLADSGANGNATLSVLSESGQFNARLTLSPSDPVDNDTLGATTLYLLPYKGNSIGLYDGASDWVTFSLGSSGISIAIPATTDTNYDVFVYDSSGLTLELVAWTDDTNRATALVKQDGVYVKTGATERLFVGTIRTTDVSGQCEKSPSTCFVVNYYNLILHMMRVKESTNSWAYTSATYRAMNNSNANRIRFLVPITEELVKATVVGLASSSSGIVIAVAVGLDSVTVVSTDTLDGQASIAGAGVVWSGRQYYKGYPGIGFHYLQALESGTTGVTFYGDNGTTTRFAGIQGEIYA